MDEEGKGFNVLAVVVFVEGREGEDQFEEARRGCEEFAWRLLDV